MKNPICVYLRSSAVKNQDPESHIQERTGPIFDLFMLLFMLAFLVWLGFVVMARRAASFIVTLVLSVLWVFFGPYVRFAPSTKTTKEIK